MNKANIDKLINRMGAIAPDQYDQEMVTHYDGQHCGTAACIAGHAYGLIRAAGVGDVLYYRDDGTMAQKHDQAVVNAVQAWLGLDDHQADALFDSFPLRTLRPTIKDAMAVLRTLRDTGEVDWWQNTD